MTVIEEGRDPRSRRKHEIERWKKRATGTTFPKEAGEIPYQFAQGERGILIWDRTADQINTWEPFVVWDDDPEKHARKVLFAAVELLGIQAEDQRFVCSK